MSLFFITKEDDNFRFVFDTTHVKDKWNPLLNYCAEESSLHVVNNPNATFYIIYDTNNYDAGGKMRCLDMYKLAMRDLLKDKESIDYNFIIENIVPKLKEQADKCFSLKHFEDTLFSPVGVYIISRENCYSITRNYFVQICQKVDSDSIYLGAIHGAKEWRFDDFINKIVELNNENSVDITYPLLFGSTKDNKLILKDKSGVTREIEKEDFVCRW